MGSNVVFSAVHACFSVQYGSCRTKKAILILYQKYNLVSQVDILEFNCGKRTSK